MNNPIYRAVLGDEATSFSHLRTIVKAKQALRNIAQPVAISALGLTAVGLAGLIIATLYRVSNEMVYTGQHYMF